MLFAEITINGAVHRVSQEGYAGEYWWAPKILRPPSLNLSHTDSGAYVRPVLSDIELAADLFGVADWPPPSTCAVVFKWGDTDTGAATFFEGTAVLAEYRRDGTVRYGLQGPELTANVLYDGVDENGDACLIPRAFGLVHYVKAKRTEDVGGLHTYYCSGINQPSVYDDGVDVTSNRVLYGDPEEFSEDKVFSLSADPVGEVTISGTGLGGGTDGLMTYASTALDLDSPYGSSTSKLTSIWQETQITWIDLLDWVMGFYAQIFYIEDNRINHYDRSDDNGQASALVLDDFGYYEAPVQPPSPIRSIRTEVYYNEVVQDRNEGGDPIGQHVAAGVGHALAEADVPSGEEIHIQNCAPYTGWGGEGEWYAQAALETLLAAWSQPRASVTMPLGSTLPLPGQRVEWVDEQQAHPIIGWLRVRQLSFDFSGEGSVALAGEGGIDPWLAVADANELYITDDSGNRIMRL